MSDIQLFDGAWIGFDLDSTIAHYGGWKGVDHHHIGEPYPEIIALIKKYIAEGYIVKIFTARVARPKNLHTDYAKQRVAYAIESEKYIKAYCLKHIGVELEVTCEKDFLCVRIYDDRARHVIANTGKVCCQCGGE